MCGLHYTRERVAERDVDIEWVPSESMVADVMTKPLGKIAFDRCSRVLTPDLTVDLVDSA